MPVLDASVYVSTLSPYEERHEQSSRLYGTVAEDERFLVPIVFRVEVVAALARRGEPKNVLDAVDGLLRGPKFETVALEPDLVDAAVSVARLARVRGYDALYVALALERRTALYTLDGDVARRVRRAFPGIDVRTS